jgi:subtilisin family serine protease
MQRSLACALAVLVFLLGSARLAWTDETITAGPAPEDAATMKDGSRLWFVELPSAPLTDGGDLASVERDRSQFRSAARRAGVRHTERRAFSKLWNGLAIAVHPADVGKLDKIGGVAGLYPVVTFAVPDLTPVNEPDLLTALAMTGADVAQNTLGLTGAGIKVGIIDTGIDYDNPALGGDGTARSNSNAFPTARVVTGYDFVGDAFNGSNAPTPDAFPDDCWGHGTHVSGIVGANGVVRGVAPAVTFGAYRVFGCSGTTTADIIIEAMERALDDGMQVVNLSIGAAFEWPQYPTAVAGDRLVSRGVVVVASMGNDGFSGLYSGSAPGVGQKLIGVASFENTHINRPAFSLSPDGHISGFNHGFSCAGAPQSGSFPMARTGTAASVADCCLPLPAGSLAGKVALVRRGTCGFYIQARNAQAAGAIGVVIYNTTSGAIAPDVAGTPPITVPVVGIPSAEGALIDSRLANGPVTLTWGATSSTPNSTGGLVSGFSAIGTTPDLELKPDLGAPGGFILSTFPLEQGGYGSNSGTSMSSPHVAGAVALLLEARPHTRASAVRDILMNNAVPSPASIDVSQLECVNRQGAGMLDIAAAVRATTRIEPGKLSLGESEMGPVARTLTIRNESSRAATYTLSNMPALGTGSNTFIATFNDFPASVTFSRNPVTVPPNSLATVDVTIAPNVAQPDRSLYGGYVAIARQDSDQEYRVPYIGFAGDYQSIVALAPGFSGFPWLAQWVGFFANRPAGATYSMVDGDVPYVLVHLAHPVKLLGIEVFDAVTGKAWHRVMQEKYIGRNNSDGDFYAIPWDGTTTHGKKVMTVPNGRYVIKASVLKALGDESNPAHWEYWTSPVVTLARPGVAVEGSGSGEAIVGVGGSAPRVLVLAPAQPNPFRGDVAFRFSLPAAGPVWVDVFDLLGRRLKTWSWEGLPVGEHEIRWDGRTETGANAPAGMVLYRLHAMGKVLTQKAVRLP